MSLLTRLARPFLALRAQMSPRTFTTLLPLRPTLAAGFRPTGVGFAPTTATAREGCADVVPAAAVTSHPALAGAAQVRFGPRNTMQGHTRLVQKRRHGWLKRMRSKTGRRILERRKLKGRRHVAW